MTLLYLVGGLFCMSCGGTQAIEIAPVPAQATYQATEESRSEHIYYHVFWDDIQVLTVYAGRGDLRSEERNNPDDLFSRYCEYMHAISHYYEHENSLIPFIEQADSLEGFFDLLREDPIYLIEEQYLEEGY
jgi:hypothetical protein